jgi:hypothetical protein
MLPWVLQPSKPKEICCTYDVENIRKIERQQLHLLHWLPQTTEKSDKNDAMVCHPSMPKMQIPISSMMLTLQQF